MKKMNVFDIRFVETHYKTVEQWSVDWRCQSVLFFSCYFERDIFQRAVKFSFSYFRIELFIVLAVSNSRLIWGYVLLGFLLPDSLLMTLMTFEHVKTWHITTDAWWCIVNTGTPIYVSICVYERSLMLYLLAQYNHSIDECMYQRIQMLSTHSDFLCWQKRKKHFKWASATTTTKKDTRFVFALANFEINHLPLTSSSFLLYFCSLFRIIVCKHCRKKNVANKQLQQSVSLCVISFHQIEIKWSAEHKSGEYCENFGFFSHLRMFLQVEGKQIKPKWLHGIEMEQFSSFQTLFFSGKYKLQKFCETMKIQRSIVIGIVFVLRLHRVKVVTHGKLISQEML